MDLFSEGNPDSNNETETEYNYSEVEQLGGDSDENNDDSQEELEDEKSDEESEEDVYEIDDDTEIKDNQLTNNIVNDEDRITIPILTKYEKVRLLGDRAKQISEGAKPLIKSDRKLSAMEIAIEELKLARIPIKIIRTRPDGSIEIWKVSELEYVI